MENYTLEQLKFEIDLSCRFGRSIIGTREGEWAYRMSKLIEDFVEGAAALIASAMLAWESFSEFADALGEVEQCQSK